MHTVGWYIDSKFLNLIENDTVTDNSPLFIWAIKGYNYWSALFSQGQNFPNSKLNLFKESSILCQTFYMYSEIMLSDSMYNIIKQYFARDWIRVPSTNNEYSENHTPMNIADLTVFDNWMSVIIPT